MNFLKQFFYTFYIQDQQKGDLKDEVIKTLHTEVKDLEGKFKQVKKRNKQLLVMLQQGESKQYNQQRIITKLTYITVLYAAS